VRSLLRRLGFEVTRYPAGTRSGTQLANVLRDLAPDLLVDVGAHLGEFGTRCRLLGYRGRIIAFDPALDPRGELAQRAGGDPLWTVLPVAIGDISGEADFNVSTQPVLSSLLPASATGVAEYVGLRRTRSVRVRVARLDEILLELAPNAERILLKSDTQGFDLHVLEGAAGVLDRIVAIHIELSLQAFYEGAPDYLEVLAWLRRRGFAPVDLDPGAMHDALLAEVDCLLRRTA
jgi:FkbM family methyltransferase